MPRLPKIIRKQRVDAYLKRCDASLEGRLLLEHKTNVDAQFVGQILHPLFQSAHGCIDETFDFLPQLFVNALVDADGFCRLSARSLRIRFFRTCSSHSPAISFAGGAGIHER